MLKEQAKIYIIKASPFKLKIGHSISPDQRMQSLQHSTLDTLELIYETDYLKEFLKVERVVHALLKSHKVKGEWFKVSDELALLSLKKAIDIVKANKADEIVKPRNYDKITITLAGKEKNLLLKIREDIETNDGLLIRISLARIMAKLINQEASKRNIV